MKLTTDLADVQHVSNYAICDLGRWLRPGHLQRGTGERGGFETFRDIRQLFSQRDRQACASLVGASAVLGDTLVDSLVLRGDAS